MSTFTASNGVVLNIPLWANAMDGPVVAALREFFLRERDDELGRWRWPENPDYVVYPHSEGREVYVVHERTGTWGGWDRALAAIDSPSDRLARAAHAYFDAHPEPKPWHNAEPGEVWVLTVDGSEEFPCSVSPSGPDFEPIAHPVWATLARGSDRITSARRIWPEVES